jgi:hypothetical protein
MGLLLLALTIPLWNLLHDKSTVEVLGFCGLVNLVAFLLVSRAQARAPQPYLHPDLNLAAFWLTVASVIIGCLFWLWRGHSLWL